MSSIGFVLTVLSVLLGLLSIALVIRKRYPGRISFVPEQAIWLFDTIIKNFPQFKIVYDGKPIGRQVLYIKGSFVNDGETDITEAMTEQPLSIRLPDGWNWVNASTTGASDKLRCNPEVDGNQLIFRCGLFRKNEFFQFEAIIEGTNGTNTNISFYSDLQFRHRISNTGKVIIRESLSDAQIARRKSAFKRELVESLSYAILCIIAILVPWSSPSPRICYELKNSTGSEILVDAAAQEDGTILMQGLRAGFSRTITPDQLQNTDICKPVIVTETKVNVITRYWKFLLVILLILGIAPTARYFRLRRSEKLARILHPK